MACACTDGPFGAVVVRQLTLLYRFEHQRALRIGMNASLKSASSRSRHA
jgi:hypothetical protein